MARRTLSLQGRVLAAGLSVALGGALVGVMAAGDHAADASQTTTTPAAAATPYDGTASGTTGNGVDGGNGGFSTGDAGFSPQPQTRTGGS